MAGWMKTPLGTEVDLGSGHIVLDGVPAPAIERGTALVISGRRKRGNNTAKMRERKWEGWMGRYRLGKGVIRVRIKTEGNGKGV